MVFLFFLITIIVLVVALLLFIKFSPQFGGKPTASRLNRYAASPHMREGRFHNLVETPMQASDGSFGSTFKEFLFGGVDRTPTAPIPFHKVRGEIFHQAQRETVFITWLGHSSLLLQFEGHTFLTDPMFGKRASPVPFLGPKRFNKQLPLSPDDIPFLDAIFLSHDHYDHLDYSTIKMLHKKTDAFFVPLGLAPHLIRWGVDPEKIVELDWWESTIFHGDIEIIATPARHFSGRGFNDRFKTLWTSWVIKSARHRIYFGADSGYGSHFKAIGDKYGPFDLTLLECGAYNNAWPFVHMMPEQTGQAHLDLRGNTLMPIHWAQFNLSLHPWREPIERLTAAAAGKNINIVTPKIGVRFEVGRDVPSTRWWENIP